DVLPLLSSRLSPTSNTSLALGLEALNSVIGELDRVLGQRLAVLNKPVRVQATKDNRSLGEMRKGVRLGLGAGSGSGLGPVFAKRLHPLLRRRVAELD